MQDERHDEAMRWFHYVFNPTTASDDPVPERYWLFKPLRDAGKPQTIKQLLQSLKPEGTGGGAVQDAIEDWRDHPFEPHRIARRRPGAYQKAVVMQYLDNLIAWGDTLFRRDTIESINEATQLYVLSARILGRRYLVPEFVKPVPQTYSELRALADPFSNALVKFETIAKPFTPAPTLNPKAKAPMPFDVPTLYFGIPPNDDLLRYWDTVADRLFKIRNSMNIEGLVRELPLFEPPIDPALLVRARAMGLDLATVLDDVSAPALHYRFTFMLQKAREFCEELKQVGALMLAALEKKDAEQVAQLRASHEKALLQAIRDVKTQQIKEAERTVAGLEQGRAQASVRRQFYTTRAFTIPGETVQLDLLLLATGLQTVGQGLQLAASDAHVVPDVYDGGMAGTGGGPIHLQRTGGGSSAGSSLQAAGRAMEILAGVAQAAGTASSLLAGYQRRAHEWKLQADIAAADIKQYDKQIAAADIRREMTERELANHELQIDQSEQIETVLREKFTSQDLYGWMSSQLSAVYFQAYRLAFDLAKRAERAYRTELGIESSSFIQFGRWDSLRKGLLAGERLSLDLRRLEAAYLDQNRRTYELTKHVSLARIDPLALLTLRQTGACELEIPEALFDLDYPGQYMRRIKSVSLTIPSVTGPYTGVSCTLTLLKHALRRQATVTSASDPMEESFSPVQSIATSGGRNDAGMFDLNFRDERRLPFEGAGVVGRWRLELPTAARQFDYETISDVIVHISYIALEGGAAFRQKRETVLKKTLTGQGGATALHAAFSIRHDFPNEWYLLQQGKTVALSLTPDRFPYFASVMKIGLQVTDWVARTTTNNEPSLALQPTGVDAPVAITWQSSMGLFTSVKEPPAPAPPLPQIALGEPFMLSSTSGDDLAALWMIVTYGVSEK
jgi:receptor-binding and translocation channel-forming TcA subunit of Tc toxin